MVKRNLFLGGPFSSFYDDIVGATAYTAAKKQTAPLTGMIADDATGKLTIKPGSPGHARALRVRDRRGRSRSGEQGDLQEHDGQPVPGRRSVHAQGREPVADQRRVHPHEEPQVRHPDGREGLSRPDRRHGLDQRQHDDGERDQRDVRLHDRGSGRRPAPAGGVAVQGPVPDRSGLPEHVLLLPEQHDPAVQQARGAAGRQLRDRSDRAPADLRRTTAPDVQPAASGDGRLPGHLTVPVAA